MDPSGGGIGKAAGELLQEMQKAQGQMQELDKASGKDPSSNFADHLKTQQTNQVQETQQINRAADILQQAKVNAATPTTRVGAAAKAERSRMTKMLDGLIGGQDKMTRIMNLALSGKQFKPIEMLAMQAGVYRFSQELELTSKVVEKATSGVKQTMNTQV